ncbi:amidohydrolase family protein (plasmid) [Geminicoccaceae bacterium 1502E]|nr:amidohydrolase family protein [Geminicoccaceae bacterium 1502E]
MADILIIHGTVATMDPNRRVIEDGAVAITGDRITAVGTTAEITAAHEAPKVIDARRKLVMPGLVDAHAHAGHGIIKTMGGFDGDAWFKACELAYTVGSDEQFWAAEARLAALERLRFGVTTGISLLGGGDTIMRTDEPDYAAAHCQGVLDVGTRSVVAVGPTRPPHPRRYARWHGQGKRDLMIGFEDQYASCEAILKEWHRSHGLRINIALLTPTLRAEHVASLGEALLEDAIDQARKVRALGRTYGTVFTQDGHRKGSVKFAHERIGILGPEALLSHSTDLTAEEVAICAETDTKIAHNPSAVASILGRCPVPELLEAGVTVAIGSDATAPDRSGDMFRHMQQCMHYHRTYYKDPHVLSPGKVLEMCTIDGARALGMEQEIGSLERGKKADVVLLDLARPHLYPLNMPLFRAVCFANGNDVATVIVDGRICMEEGRVLTVDENKVLDEAQLASETLLERTGLHHLLDMPEKFWGAVRF